MAGHGQLASAAERKAVEITCRATSDGRVLFTVRDYGPGIAKGQMRKIFELFYRPANELTRETAGTGIGLALVRKAIERLGGKVWAQSKPGEGLNFKIELP